jgi:three-Cys-motif partner protein
VNERGGDQVGPWTQIKLEIVRKYATAYTRIIRRYRLRPVYVDAFAGFGAHTLKETNTWIPGSPLNAMLVDPPFEEFHLIDIAADRVAALRRTLENWPNVHVHGGDCNEILLRDVFPRVAAVPRNRVLCFLDPYGLHLDWGVVAEAGRLGTVEVFLNFPVLDMNRNALWRDADKAHPQQRARLTRFWGDESWRDAAYDRTQNLFGWPEKLGNEVVVTAFCNRLKEVAGFRYVAPALPMRQHTNSDVYYLLFASPNSTGAQIVSDIFAGHRNWQ